MSIGGGGGSITDMMRLGSREQQQASELSIIAFSHWPSETHLNLKAS